MPAAHCDYMGLPLTSGSVAAADHLSGAIRGFNDMSATMMQSVKAALAEDPAMPAAHAVRGLALCSARNARFQSVIDASLAAAEAGLDAVSPRERLLIEALRAASAGRLRQAVAAYEALLGQYPTDAFTQKLAQLELFRMGDAEEMRRIAETGADAWTTDTPAYATWMSVRAFAHEEALDFPAAERFGRTALDHDPRDGWGTHAVAHVLVMQGRVEEGIAWLQGLSGNWADMNPFVHHLWWHLCLFLLERGDHDRILDLYDSKVWNPDSPLVRAIPDHYVDLENAASLLLRLELRGVAVGDRWTGLVDQAEARLQSHVCPFTSAHAAIVFAANGRFDRAVDLVENMASFAARNTGPIGDAIRLAALPAARAAVAHRRGDWQEVVSLLLPVRANLPAMGGSHAQRDIFFQILVDALRRLERPTDVLAVMGDIRANGFAALDQRTFYAQAA